MRTSIRFSLVALLAGFALVLGACSTESAPPDGLAFTQDDSSQDSQDPPVQDDTTTAAPTTTTAAPTTTVPRVNRPTDRTCSTSDHSIAFNDSVVLITPSPTTAGPFTVSVPAGTYDITLSSWLGFEDYAGHDMESWYFTTDSGYTSPTTTDSSPELIYTDLFSAQTIPATTSITLYHKSPSASLPNSVHPLCIGFRAVAAPATTTTTTAAPTTTTTAASAVIAAAQTTTTTTAAPATTTTAAPATTTTAAPATAAPAELALTGASELSMSLGLAGAALTLAGAATLIAARRTEED